MKAQTETTAAQHTPTLRERALLALQEREQAEQTTKERLRQERVNNLRFLLSEVLDVTPEYSAVWRTIRGDEGDTLGEYPTFWFDGVIFTYHSLYSAGNTLHIVELDPDGSQNGMIYWSVKSLADVGAYFATQSQRRDVVNPSESTMLKALQGIYDLHTEYEERGTWKETYEAARCIAKAAIEAVEGTSK